MRRPPYNHLMWSTPDHLPQEVREALIQRLSSWTPPSEEEWKRLEGLVGIGSLAVAQIFESEKLRWAVLDLLSRFEGMSVQAAVKAVAIMSAKSPERVKQVYYRVRPKQRSPYEDPLAAAEEP